MAESPQASGSQPVEATTGVTVPGDSGDTTVVETSTKEGGPIEMEDVNNVKDNIGLAQDGKQEGDDTSDGGQKDSEGKRKLEKQENIICMKDEKDNDETHDEDKGSAKVDAEVVECKVTARSKEHAIGGDTLESVEDLEAQNDVEHVKEGITKWSEEINRQEIQVSQLDKLVSVNQEVGKHEGCEVKLKKLKDVKDANDLDDSHRQSNKRTGEQKRKGIMTQVKEKLKKQLTESDDLDKTEDAEDMSVKAGRKDGTDDEKYKAETLRKKYKRKKPSQKWNQKHDITQAMKGRESKSEKPIYESVNTEQLEDISEKNKENGEHDVERTELEKLEEQDVKDGEGLCQVDETSDDAIKHENHENEKVVEDAELEDGDSEDIEETVDSDDEEKESKRKLSRGKKDRESGEKVRDGRKTLHEEPTTPGILADRPVRERKTVVRLVEVIEKEQGEGLRIEKGRGTPLKDIPNVVNKLSRRKPEDIKLLHLILFGRKGKAPDFKSHISQFSGFVWPENEEKHKAKVKEKLDKCPGPKLLDLCDLFDIAVSKTASEKEELVEKLLDFLIAPYPTTDVKSPETEQHSAVKRKRSSGGSLSGSIDPFSSKPLKKRQAGSSLKYSVDNKGKDEKRGKEDKGRGGNGLFIGNEDSDYSGSEKENDSIENVKENDTIENVNTEDFDYSKKESKREKNKSAKKSPLSKKTSPLSSGIGAKKSTSKRAKGEEAHDSGGKVSASKHMKAMETHDSGTKVSTSKHTNVEETHDSGPKVFSRRKKVDTPKKLSSKQELRVKDIGRKLGSSKLRSDKPDKTEPNKVELRKMISVILKEVDFNTATFKDILKQLGTRFKADLTHMKEEIKVMTKEELVKIAEEEANSDDEEEASDDEETAQPAANKLRI